MEEFRYWGYIPLVSESRAAKSSNLRGASADLVEESANLVEESSNCPEAAIGVERGGSRIGFSGGLGELDFEVEVLVRR